MCYIRDLRKIAPFNLADAEQQFRLPELDEVKIAISKLKAAGSDGIAAELFKAAGDDF